MQMVQYLRTELGLIIERRKCLTDLISSFDALSKTIELTSGMIFFMNPPEMFTGYVSINLGSGNINMTEHNLKRLSSRRRLLKDGWQKNALNYAV